MESSERFRREVHLSLGAEESDLDTLLGYGCSRFAGLTIPSLPLVDEPLVSAWRDYVREASTRGVLPVLREKLVQLRFPIREGISREDEYRAATLKGSLPEPDAHPLALLHPERLELTLRQTAAGSVPILTAGCRPDFVALVQALSGRNEPVPVLDSMGAAMVAGLNNWDRIARYRRTWEDAHPEEQYEWPEEFSRLIAQKDLYQDRLIILSDGPYSDIAAETVGMAEEDWYRTSLVIRQAHECSHYVTKRVFGSMKNAIHDEFLADFAGIAAATGTYRATWFLLFLGLEDFPHFRPGGRLQIYLGETSPDDRLFSVIVRMIKNAAENLERFICRIGTGTELDGAGRTELFFALAGLHMEELASSGAEARIADRLAAFRSPTTEQ